MSNLYNSKLSYIAPFINKRGSSILPWPLSLSILLSEEEYYRNLLYNSDKLPKKLEKSTIDDIKVLLDDKTEKK